MNATPFWPQSYDDAFAAELARREAKKLSVAYRMAAPRQLREILPLLDELTPANAPAQVGAIKRILAARGQNLEMLALTIKQEQFPDESRHVRIRDALDFLAVLGRTDKSGAIREGALALAAILKVHSSANIKRFAEALMGWNEGTIVLLEWELRRAEKDVLDLLHNGLGPKTEPGDE